MGFESRDYAWDSPTRREFLGGYDRVVKRLIGVTVAVFVLQILTAGVGGPASGRGFVTSWFGLDPDLVLRGQIWRLLTYAFLHSERDIFHILFNMLWLFSLGRFAEAKLGSREFLFFYLAAAVAGGIVFCGLDLAFPTLATAVTPDGELVSVRLPVVCVGASGAVAAVVLLSALWDPHREVSLILFSVPLWAIAGLFVVLETYAVLSIIGGVGGNEDGTAHGAHFGGLLLGYLYYRFDWRLAGLSEAITDRLPRFTFGGFKRAVGAGPKVRLHRPESEDARQDDLERRGDAVLAKLHASGESSLTDEERATLKLYSQQAKAKRDRS
jgi:membrane associated rhomboid family serine protease